VIQYVTYIYILTVMLKKKREYNEEVRQLFIDFKKAYDSDGERSYIRFSLSLVSLGNL